ncbi:MAG: nucleoside-triphosphatase [Daejeonella sp.]
MESRIYILSKTIRSGKTTQLLHWAKINDAQLSGILTPDVNGIRMIYDLSAKQYFPFQVPEDVVCEDSQQIGRFTFYQSAFNQANHIIERAFLEDPDWLVIDEVGPLELLNKGFDTVLKTIIPAYLSGKQKGNLLLVIRESLLVETCHFYNIHTYQSFDLSKKQRL